MPLMVQILHCEDLEGQTGLLAPGSSTESWLDNLVWAICESDKEYVVIYISMDRVECYKVHLVYSVKPHGRQWPTSKEK